MSLSPSVAHPNSIPDATGGRCRFSSRQRILSALILSTDKEFRGMVREELRRLYFINAVNDGIEAVDAILAKDFDLILCDVRSPALLGEAFYKSAIRMRPRLRDRFVFITGVNPCARVKAFLAEAGAIVAMNTFTEAEFADVAAFIELKLIDEPPECPE